MYWNNVNRDREKKGIYGNGAMQQPEPKVLHVYPLSLHSVFVCVCNAVCPGWRRLCRTVSGHRSTWGETLSLTTNSWDCGSNSTAGRSDIQSYWASTPVHTCIASIVCSTHLGANKASLMEDEEVAQHHIFLTEQIRKSLVSHRQCTCARTQAEVSLPFEIFHLIIPASTIQCHGIYFNYICMGWK